MPKLVRQHSALVSLVGAFAIGAILIWWVSATPAPARATPAAAATMLLPPPLDPVIAGEIAALRNDVGLSNDALNVLCPLNEPHRVPQGSDGGDYSDDGADGVVRAAFHWSGSHGSSWLIGVFGRLASSCVR